MTRAITTKYFGCGDRRGACYKATGARRTDDRAEISLTDASEHAKGYLYNHARVAKLLATRMRWFGLYVAGDMPDSDGSQAFVCVMEGHLAADKARLVAIAGMLELSAKVEGRDFFIALEG